MSWKLTKKLKETHLGPLTSTFSRSPSTSTITDKDSKSQGDISGAVTPTNENTIAASEALTQAPVVAPPKPGILVVTLHEGQGFSLPEQHRASFNNPAHGGNSLSTGNALNMSSSIRPSSSSRTSGFMGRPQTSGGFSGIPTNHGRISSKYMPYALIDFDKLQVFVNSVEGTPENPLWAGSNTQYKFDSW
ncbi:Serine/threonine-protein kinase [Podospora pseudopauciseta]|uniref:Serine/threonine-protein kinase n=1 Tax=Podospora pseudopauciseta TaxID=2093780 RepID=A0ABR0H6I8_9PEZI|nr:Serine/threonine-protein kinase [Podospora pseudopauciseta]